MSVSICVHTTTYLPWSKPVRENYNGHKYALWWYNHSHLPSTVICPQTQYIKPGRQIRTCDAEGVLELLNSHEKELTLDDLTEIRKQSAPEEADEPEPEPELKERTMGV